MRDILRKSEGIEAWRDISFREEKDGTCYFRGTAYFADLSRLRLPGLTFLTFCVQRNLANDLVVTEGARNVHDNPLFPAARVARSAERPTRESVQRDRTKFRAGKPILMATIGTMKQDITLRVPGRVANSWNFETNAPGVLGIRFAGERMVKALEEVVSDDDLMLNVLTNTSAQSDPAGQQVLNEKLYGQRAPIKAVIKTDAKPMFDYRAEVAAALKEFPATARDLGLEGGSVLSPAQSGMPVSVKVTGIEWDFGRPQDSHYILKLVLQLSGPVHEALRVKVESAETVEGLDLLREGGWEDLLSFPKLAADNRTVTCHVKLQSPPLESKGIRKVSGVLECASMESVASVEMISGELKPGARGSQPGVMIQEIERPASQAERIILKLDKEPDGLRSLRIEGTGGQCVNLERQGEMAINGQRLYTLVASAPVPQRGRLMAELNKNVPTLKFPFAVTNLTLLGQQRTVK